MIEYGIISHYIRISYIKKSNYYNKIRYNKINLLKIYLNYDSNGKSVLIKIKHLSTPGNKKYISVSNLKKNFKLSRSDLIILSTNKGILTAHEAIFKNIGGELICNCQIY